LADMIKGAINDEVLTLDDLYSTTESHVIQKLKGNHKTAEFWDRYTKIKTILSSDAQLIGRYCVNIPAKKRYIDPLVISEGGARRISSFDEAIKKDIEKFLSLDFDKWLYAKC